MERPQTQAEKQNRKLADLKYPLVTQKDYKARLVFSIEQPIPVNMDGVFNMAKDKIKEAIGIEDVSEETDADKIAAAKKNNQEKQKEVEEMKGRIKPVAGQKLRNKNLGRRVSLYMPQGLVFRDNATYEGKDLGATGAAALAGIQGAGTFLGNILSGAGQTFAAGIAGSANKDLAKLGTQQVLSGVLPESIGAAFQVASGVTTNPNTRSLFKNVGMREFSFQFKMIAQSRDEANQINEIVRFFRTELYPEKIKITVGGGEGEGEVISVGYNFPNMFKIQLFYDNEEIDSKIMPKIANCYLRDINVSYNASGQLFHDDSQPFEVDMTLAFQETRTLSREDIEAGF